MPARPPRTTQRPRPSLTPPGGRGSGFATWTRRRKLRLARTAAILLVLVIIVWQCTGTDGTVKTSSSTTGPTIATTTTEPPPATTATATVLTPKLPAKGYLAGAAPLGRKIVIAGGLDSKKNSTSSLWAFDPATGETTKLGDLSSPLHGAAVATLDKVVLVMGGGKGTSVFDEVLSISASGTVTAIGKLPQKRTGATAITDPDDGSVLVVGGFTGKDGALEVLRTSNGTTFNTAATLLHPVRYPAVVALQRSVFVIGGEFDNVVSSGVQRIDLATGTVTDVAQLPLALTRASGFALGGSIFVAGGRTTKGKSNQIYRIDPATGQTSVAGALPEERSDAAVAVSRRTAYLFAGLAPTAVDSVVSVTVK